jgi:hypothetical protein
MTSVDRAIDLPVETAAPRPWAVPFVFRHVLRDHPLLSVTALADCLPADTAIVELFGAAVRAPAGCGATVRQVNESEINTPSPLRTAWIANGGTKRPVPGSMTNVSIRSSPSNGRR